MTSASLARRQRALVLRAPGINCDRETAHACRLVGFETDLLHINQLLQAPERLLDYALLVIPGGFSYGDDLGAGTLLARNLTIHLGSQLDQFIDEGRLVLGICNGFQVLVRAGLLPGYVTNAPDLKCIITCPPDRVPRLGYASLVANARRASRALASLTDNMSAQFESRWVTLGVEISMCIFTQWIKRPIELPIAHGEGQFVLADDAMLAQLQKSGQVPLVYSSPTGGDVVYPGNPNGSIGNIAGVCNARGNVFGLMPHPERYVSALQHPQRRSTNDGEGDGLLIFKNAYEYARTLPPVVGARFIAPLGWSRGTTGSGAKELKRASQAPLRTLTHSSYTSSGVDIAAADAAKELMKDAVRSTHGAEVLAGMGAFAGVFDASSIQQMQRPALVASTDGVGTKTLIAAQAGRFDTIGNDLVNHCVNDLLCQGAKPLFFMDYLAMSKLDPMQAATIVRGVAEACREVGCALLGGETAEMPDVYLPGTFDLAGTIVGVVEQDAIINTTSICAGDVLLGLSSSGLHTNGYSLARRVFAPYALDTVFPELGEPLVDALLRPHRCYLKDVEGIRKYLADRGSFIKGIAHITGGSFAGNIARILPAGTQAVIETGAWTVPPLFQLLARLGRVSHAEMYRTLNMGIGMVLVLPAEAAEQARHVHPELLTVGYITEGDGVNVSGIVKGGRP
jgi:phosphoribosylformylglycinamidine synthase I